MPTPQRHNQDADDLLTPIEAAELISVSVRSLYRWEDDGRISPSRTPGGHRRYRRADVLALIAEKSA